MKIALVEFQYHEVILRTFSNLFSEIDYVDVVNIITSGVAERVLNENVLQNVVIISKDYKVPSKRKPIKYLKSKIHLKNLMNKVRFVIEKEKPNIVIFNTVSSNLVAKNIYNKFRNNHKQYFAFVVSNIDFFYKNEKKNYFKKLVEIGFYTIFATKFESDFAKKSIKEIKKSHVLPIKTVSKRGLELSKKILSNVNRNENELIISIPGEVTTYRRDYIELLNCINKLINEGEKIKIYLLGRMLDDKVEKWLNKNPSVFSITTIFNSFIPEKTYEDILFSSHFVLSPIPFNSKYGIFKMTGAVEDAICAGIPMIIPNFYFELIKEDIKGSSIVYSDNSRNIYFALKKAIDGLKNGEYVKLKKNALKNQKIRLEKSILLSKEFISLFKREEV